MMKRAMKMKVAISMARSITPLRVGLVANVANLVKVAVINEKNNDEKKKTHSLFCQLCTLLSF
jgi:hypothetical protein